MADDDHRNARYELTPPGQWSHTPHIQPHSYHGTPATEFQGFHFGAPQLPMEPGAFSSGMSQRPVVQPLIMPQWPSMLPHSSHTAYQPIYPQPVQPIQPVTMGQLQTPVSASSTRSTTTPRKTLTDNDRKRMCQYAEEHPNAKQTEIGSIFGVERSTVSKVLRQKEKYLVQDEGTKSPIKRAKGRPPDIERTLAVWAEKQERKGVRLTDEILRDQARVFAATTTSTPENQQMLSTSWLEKFKLKHNLMGARSRKSSLAPEDAEALSATASSSHSPSGASPLSPDGLASPELHSAQSQESLKNESPDSYGHFGRHGPLHTQSTTSLNSAFTDTAPSSFSPLHDSPFFASPESGTAAHPWGDPPLTARIVPAAMSANSHRPRSQTFPLIESLSAPAVSEATLPKYTAESILDSPMEEAPDPLTGIDGTIDAKATRDRVRTVSPAATMRPPPLPSHVQPIDSKRELVTAKAGAASTSRHEAQQALETVMKFIDEQPADFLDFQESLSVGKLMAKLQVRSASQG